MTSDRMRKEEADALGKAVGEILGLGALLQEVKAQETISPETERQLAWAKIKDLISRRAEPAAVAAAIRDRLHEKYDVEEVRQSWLTLTDADPITFIRIFCQLPYLSTGKTDPIARAVMETYVTRLTHEKYAGTYQKVITSLRNMFKAKPDAPTLMNFTALIRWVDAEAANKVCNDIGMPVAA